MFRRAGIALLLPLLLLAGAAPATETRVVTDQLDRQVTVPTEVHRIGI